MLVWKWLWEEWILRDLPGAAGGAASQLLVHQLEDLSSSLQSPQLKLNMAAYTYSQLCGAMGQMGPWGLLSAILAANSGERAHLRELIELDTECPLLVSHMDMGLWSCTCGFLLPHISNTQFRMKANFLSLLCWCLSRTRVLERLRHSLSSERLSKHSPVLNVKPLENGGKGIFLL